MKPFSFDADLCTSIRSKLKAGMDYSEAVIDLAIEHGFSFPIAYRIVESALRECSPDGILFDPVYYPDSKEMMVRSPDYVDYGPSREFLTDEGVTLIAEWASPRVILLSNFLSSDQCLALINCAISKGPTVEERHALGNLNVVHFPSGSDLLVDRAVARVSRAFDWPMENLEIPKILHYRPGGYITHHSEYFKTNEVNQRIANCIIYLNEPKSGGATILSNLGLRVHPRLGGLLFFGYPEPVPNSGTMHAGEPVSEGEKWLLTIVFRQSPVDHHVEACELGLSRE
ncbi:2OG-Fe(II) oxygenase [Paraburkholderia megapolitana]|uniref:Prolyl 4-hydroxylase n=1 Tax=Paraburkholderia megapolitana TaxID=420953 RepID=A0A1I3WBQ1_9BURK|nr:2OG-Fe(II) oxygenase [Paraburkholderia megapolitana]QDQ82215.1 hypothetical protein FNZ07_13015 [Paraburkholderia megapolitana]SFK04613.1 prolyl 4-hydroxylase [Paraburkholderia megapolitana]